MWVQTNAEAQFAFEVNILEILERAKSGGEVVPWNQDVRDEALKRGAKAGYVTRNGEDPRATKIMATVLFGERKLNIWPRDENGQLIDD